MAEDTPESSLRLQSVSGVTWTDDDGTTYRREFRDGDIVDVEVPDSSGRR